MFPVVSKVVGILGVDRVGGVEGVEAAVKIHVELNHVMRGRRNAGQQRHRVDRPMSAIA